MACGIYKITNQMNGKVYIGQSIKIENRWEEHRKKSFLENSEEYNYPLYQAIRKYGLENFNFEILEECSPEELNQKEIDYISLYESYPPDKGKGYNQTPGGECGRQFKLSESQIEEFLYLLKNSNLKAQEIADKFSISIHAVYDFNKGIYYKSSKFDYPLREKAKHRYKSSEGFKEFSPSLCIKCNKPISKSSISKMCHKCLGKAMALKLPPKEDLLKDLYDLKKDYLVAEKYNISTMLLKKWKEELDIPRKRPLVDKMYQEECLGIISEEKPKRVVKPVLQISLETGEILNEFENCNQAAKYLGFQKSNSYTFKGADSIRECCLGKIKKSHGYFWKYKD